MGQHILAVAAVVGESSGLVGSLACSMSFEV